MAGNANDLRVGMRALDRGYLKPAQLQEAIVEHARYLEKVGAAAPSFDFFLLSRGYLKPEQLASVIEDGSSARIPAVKPVLPPPPAPRKAPGQHFGKYFILRELGRGGMGDVVEAIDTTQGRRVALKRPFPRNRLGGTTADEERFLREATLVARLPRHPNLLEVYESGTIDGQCYIAMEVVDGKSMSEWRTSATLRQELDVLFQVMAAVDHAHQHGVIHRDLKPSNVMIRDDGRAVVTDFGLAKGPASGDISLTPAGMVVGSPGYMSPEQARCLKNIDGRTDVYSLGVMLYQILTGRKPFEGRSAMQILLRMMQDPVRRPSEIMRAGLNPVLYQDIEKVCLRALQREPRDRHPSVKLFREDLQRALQPRRDDARVLGTAV